MRKMTMMAIGAAIMAVAIPFAAYYWTRPNENPLGDILRRYGFVPIYPPSNLINVGSLYYVDAAVRQFTAICNADKADLDGAVVTSRSWEMQESLERNGRFKTGVHVDIGEAIGGSLDKNYAVTLNTSLTDVVLEEIPLGANLSIFQKLMAKPQCSQIATQYLRTGGYVCQGQKILQATAEFRLGRDAQSKLATSANTTPETIKDAVKQAIASQGEQSVVDKEGQRFIGSALNYGVSMNPMCLAPPEGRFSRVLPKSALGRVTNFVLFNIVEPILPARPGGMELAQDIRSGTGLR